MENIETYLSEILEIPRNEVTQCSSFYETKSVAKNEFLLKDGEVCNATYFVEKGLLRMYSIDKNGKEHIIQFAMENWWISDFQAFYTGVPSVTSIHCLEDVELYAISRKDLEKICLDNHKVEHFFRIKNSLGYVALQKRILSLLTTDARERFEQFSAQYPKLIQRVPKKIIASYLGVSRETLSRITRKL